MAEFLTTAELDALEGKPGGDGFLSTADLDALENQGDAARGFGNTVRQLPQLGYGLAAGAGAAIENVAGEGGIGTGLKKFGVEGYQRWGDKVAANGKETDSLTYSWERAKEGDVGALVDWLQYGIGYAGGQGLQMLATAGVGSMVGKLGAKAVAEKVASGLITKESARIAATEEGAKLAAGEVAKMATANVASRIGQATAIGATAYGMEGGEIFGDLVSQAEKDGRSVGGDELAKAFGATIAAGSLEFVGDKIGLDLMLGKSSLLKPAAGMSGVGGRAARGAIGATAGIPIEGGTEYLQTGIEEYGKGKEESFFTWNQSEEARRQAFDAAGLGAIGGAAMGGVGGALSPARKDPIQKIGEAQTADEAIGAFQEATAPPADPLALPNIAGAPLVVFPDGSTMTRAEAQQRYSAEELARLDAMVQDADAVQPLSTGMPQVGSGRGARGFNIAVGEEFERQLIAAEESARQGTGATPESNLPLIGQAREESAPQALALPDRPVSKAVIDLAETIAQMPQEAQAQAVGRLSPTLRAQVQSIQSAAQRSVALELPSRLQAGNRQAAIENARAIEAASPFPPKAEKIDNRALENLYPPREIPSLEQRAEQAAGARAVAGARQSAEVRAQELADEEGQGTPSVQPRNLRTASDGVLKVWARLKDKAVADSAKAEIKRRADEQATRAAESARIVEQEALAEQEGPAQGLSLGSLQKLAAMARTPEAKASIEARIATIQKAANGQVHASPDAVVDAPSGAQPGNEPGGSANMDAARSDAQPSGMDRSARIAGAGGASAVPVRAVGGEGVASGINDATTSQSLRAQSGVIGQQTPAVSDLQPEAAPGQSAQQIKEQTDGQETGTDADEGQNADAGQAQEGLLSGAGADVQAPIQGTITPSPSGTVTVTGYAPEAIRAAAQKIGARVIVGKSGPALFSVGTDVDSLRAELDVEAQMQDGPFGPIFGGFDNDPEGAIAHLMAAKTGEVPNAIMREETGPIAFVYGDSKMGLKHIAEKRGESFLNRIPGLLRSGRVVADEKGLPRAYVVDDSDPAHVAVIRLEWDRSQKTWLMTAYVDSDGRFAGGEKIADTPAAEASEVPAGKDGVVFSQEPGPTNIAQAEESSSGSRPENEAPAATKSKPDDTAANAVLDAAQVTGRDRLEAIEKFRAGTYSLEDLRAAYPATEPASDTRFSRGDQSGLDFAAEFLNELSFEDPAFRYPVSSSSTLEGNVLDALPGAEYMGEDTRPDEREESQADRRFVFATPNGKIFYVFARGNEVWIDVSRLSTGDQGGAIYHGVANYAHNTGRVFVGDPNGLSEDAQIRRTSAMLSSALRFGTTKHIAPAREQTDGAPEKGIEPLEWKDGDDVANLRSLIHTYISTLHQKFPAIKGYRYDFGRLQFVDARGRPVDATRLNLGAGSRDGRASRAGEASLRRGILIQSLASSESGERPAILENVLSRSAQLASEQGGLKAVFSRSRGAGISLRDAKATIARVSAGFKNLPQIIVHESVSEAPASLQEQIRQAGAENDVEAAFHEGEIHVFTDHIANEERLEHVLFEHEMTHYGLRGVFGEALDQRLNELWLRNKELRERAREIRKTLGLTSNVEAIEEALAELPAAELAKLKGWHKIALAVRDWLASHGFTRLADKLTSLMESAVGEQTAADLEAANMVRLAMDFARNGSRNDRLYRGTRFSENGDRIAGTDMNEFFYAPRGLVKDGERAVDALNRLGKDAFDANRNEPIAPAGSGATRFSRAAGTSKWDGPEPSKMDDFIYSLQDKQIDMKRVVQAIKDQAGAITDKINPYLQEELFHGRAAKGVKDFLDLELRPLMQEMRMRGVEMSDFEEYLWNRHAEERNNQIASLENGMKDGGSGIKTADARAYLSGLSQQKRAGYESLAKRVDAINKSTRQMLISSGLEKAGTIAAWEGAYQHYVPLQREDIDTGGNGTGQGFSIKGSASKRAVGSNKPVADILANIAMQREKTIVRAEKNRMSNALLGLAAANPNPDFWKVDEAPKERVVEPGKTNYRVLYHGSLVREFSNRPAAQQFIDFEGKAGYTIDEEKSGERVVERVIPGFISRDNVVSTRINGEDHYVVFNERDERALRMAQAIKNLDADQLGRVLSATSRVTRYFAAINTQFNPIFGVINLTRDVQGALLNLSTTPIAGEQKKVLSYTVDALRGIYADIRAHRKGQVPNSAWAQLWEEFQKEGGQTGYRDQYANSEARAEELEKELRRVGEGKAKAFGRAVFDWLSDYNSAMENAVRLAAYRAAKESGQSNQQAASLAKNLTVNFNRKGQVATQVGALYAFFNASAQGTARLAETLTGPMGKKIIGGGILLGSMQAMLLAAAGMGEDEPPEFVRERSLIIPDFVFGSGKYLSLPMPLGFHAIVNLGRIPTEFAMSGFKNPTKRIADLFGVFADTFNPIGNAGISLQTISPTVVDPFAALAENRDWTGKPIAREDMNPMSPTPGHSRHKDTATTWSKAIAYGINALSGGSKYRPGMLSPTPDQIDYLIGQVTGGVGREVSKIEQTAVSAVTGEELPMHKIPLLGRFVGDTKGQAAEGGKFYESIKRINGHEAELKGLRKDGKGAEAAEYLRDNREAMLVPAANAVERDVQKLRKAKREAVEAGNQSRVKLIEMQITARMAAFNKRVRTLQDRP